jgi:hypothetical protein
MLAWPPIPLRLFILILLATMTLIAILLKIEIKIILIGLLSSAAGFAAALLAASYIVTNNFS